MGILVFILWRETVTGTRLSRVFASVSMMVKGLGDSLLTWCESGNTTLIIVHWASRAPGQPSLSCSCRLVSPKSRPDARQHCTAFSDPGQIPGSGVRCLKLRWMANKRLPVEVQDPVLPHLLERRNYPLWTGSVGNQRTVHYPHWFFWGKKLKCLLNEHTFGYCYRFLIHFD